MTDRQSSKFFGSLELPAVWSCMPDNHYPHTCLTCGDRQTSLFQGNTFGDKKENFTCSSKCYYIYHETLRMTEEREGKSKKNDKEVI